MLIKLQTWRLGVLCSLSTVVDHNISHSTPISETQRKLNRRLNYLVTILRAEIGAHQQRTPIPWFSSLPIHTIQLWNYNHSTSFPCISLQYKLVILASQPQLSSYHTVISEPIHFSRYFPQPSSTMSLLYDYHSTKNQPKSYRLHVSHQYSSIASFYPFYIIADCLHKPGVHSWTRLNTQVHRHT